MTLQYGATSSLQKPFRPSALVAAVTECLAKPSGAASA
jgi:DNA-binding response OmpR family regulator